MLGAVKWKAVNLQEQTVDIQYTGLICLDNILRGGKEEKQVIIITNKSRRCDYETH